MNAFRDDRVAHAGGEWRDGFAGVADAFAANFSDGLEHGAAFCVWKDGAPLIDLWGGLADPKRERAWARDTIACVFSTGKAALAFLAARAVSQGRLDYDAPLAGLWPEFAAAGKADVTLAMAMSHQAGLPAMPEDFPPEDYLDWSKATAALAGAAPAWPPGSAHGYHPQTVGFIIGEALRRREGASVGRLLRETRLETGRVLCGLTPDEIAAAAAMTKPPRPPDLGEINAHTRAAFLRPNASPSNVSREAWAAAEIPAANMHADARGLAELLHPLANHGPGDAVISPSARAAAFAERARGLDLVLPFDLSWAAGLMRNINGHFGPNESALGHAGFGGSCVVLDPDHRMTVAYVMNKMSPALVGDERPTRLLKALYEAF